MPVIPTILAEISRPAGGNNGVIPLPLSHIPFTFDSFGLASFFGGDNAFASIATTILLPYRYCLGWYNAPGSIEIAAQYIRLANPKISDALFLDAERDPAKIFKLDGKVGPKFVAAHSGVVFESTGHPGSLIMSRGETMKLTRRRFEERNAECGTGHSVTVVNLQRTRPGPANNTYFPSKPSSLKAFWSLVPISASVGACMLCALVADWYCFASIAVGMVAHGFACLVIGSGQLCSKHHRAVRSCPFGDGVLKGDKDVVVLVGGGGEVNAITQGRFFLRNGANAKTDVPQADAKERSCSGIRWPSGPYMIWPSALLLMAQPLIQLFLIPLGTLFGQLMFIATVIVSWMHNIYLACYVNRDGIQTTILVNLLDLEDDYIQKYQLSRWTSTIAFTSLILASVRPIDNPLAFLDALLPNDMAVWKAWKDIMAGKLKRREYFDGRKELDFFDADFDAVVEKQPCNRELLETFLHDAQDAWKAWTEIRDDDAMVALCEQQNRATKEEL